VNPPSKKLYETLVAITPAAKGFAIDRENQADGPDERLELAELKANLIIADHFIEEYAEQYKHGELT
jgi:hypothetical protein